MPNPGGAGSLTVRSARVSAARRLHRRGDRERLGLFLAEGPQAVREALQHRRADVVEVFATAAAQERYPQIAERAGRRLTAASEQVLAAMAETVNPQGLIAVCRLPSIDLAEVTAGGPLLVAVLARAQDPGNAGTVLRTADAAGADAVLLGPGSVDPYNGKAVRASAGSVFHLPVVPVADLAAALAQLRSAGLRILATDGAGDADLDDVIDSGGLSGPTAWLFGNEARGLAEEVAALADQVVRIPIHGAAESLNLASAAAVCLYASARAHRSAPRA